MNTYINNKNRISYIVKTRRLLLLLVPILAVACSSPSELQKSDSTATNLPSTYQVGTNFSEVEGRDSSQNIANIPFDQYFQDTSLINLIKDGLAYNNDLLAAINRLDIAEANVKQAKLLQLPTLSVGAEGNYNRLSDNGLTGSNTTQQGGAHHYEDYTLQAQLSWEADIWGKIRNRQKYELADYLKTVEASQAVRTQVIASIARGYYNLLILERQYEIARSSLLLADSTLELTRLLKNAGKANQLSVQQTAAQRETVALLLPELEDQIARQQNALMVLTGKFPGRIGDHEQLSKGLLPTLIQTGTPAEILNNRPDVRQAEQELKMAISRIGIAKANLYPSLRITAFGGVESLKTSNWFNVPASLFGVVTGSLLQPVFQQGALKRDYKVANLEKEGAVINFRSTVLHAITEVSDVLTHYQKLNDQSQMASRQVDTLQQGATNASLLYRSGLANYLEVINAQNSALQAELNLASIHGRELIATVDLYRSLGGGRAM